MKPTSAFPTITITFLVNLDSAPLSSSPTYTVYFLVCLLDELAPPGWFFTSSQDLQLFLPNLLVDDQHVSNLTCMRLG